MTADRFTFRSAGTECVGYRHIPDGAAELPAVILCPGFGGTQDTPALVAAATAFADAGYVSVTFDYRSFGESGGRPRQIPTVPGQLVDIQAVVEHVRHWPEVDPERVVLWGSSLGGGHAVTAAARDPRIAAVIAQVPFNGFPKRAEGRSARDTRRILAAMVKDRLRATFGREPHYLPAVGDVGELAVMASRDAKRTISTMTSKTWQNRVAPRGLVDMMRYRPSDHAPRVLVPVLICIGEHDRETTGDTTRELAARLPTSELRAYPCAHFDIYREDVRAAVIADQVEFLTRVVPLR